MTNDARLITRFRVSDDDLEKDPTISEVYNDYVNKRWEFGKAASELKEATKKLYTALDEPLHGLRQPHQSDRSLLLGRQMLGFASGRKHFDEDLVSFAPYLRTPGQRSTLIRELLLSVSF
jgi:hypothetical protein